MPFCNPELVNSNYRSHQPLAAAARRGGHELLPNAAGRRIALHEIRSCDVVHVHRIASPEAIALARVLREEGVGIVWDNDDDVAALPRSNPHYARLGAAGRRAMVAGTAEMVRLAHVVTTPSAVLADKYREQGATDVRVLENHLPRAFMGVKPIAHDGVVIACLAGLEHRIDYDRLGVREALARVLATHRDVRVLTIGLGLGLPPERTEHVPLAGFLDLVRILARADVGLAPLVDMAWNRARSNVKLKEYAAAGLAWLASPVGPYVGMGEREGGRLVADGDWQAAIEQLVRDARARRKLAKRGGKWVKGESVDRHAGAWEAALRDAAGRARPRTRAAA
ncbi:MAG TPA: glycosyltransferase [Conexibacter sp.]|nr:glycosyltransferase [Conexibacter sp.]